MSVGPADTDAAKDEMKDEVDFMAKTHAEELRNRELLLAEERKDFMMRLETERTEYEKTCMNLTYLFIPGATSE